MINTNKTRLKTIFWIAVVTITTSALALYFFNETQKKPNAKYQARSLVQKIALNAGQPIYMQFHDNGCKTRNSGWLGYYTNCSVSQNKFNKNNDQLLDKLDKTTSLLKQQEWTTETTIDQTRLDLANQNGIAAFWQFKNPNEPNTVLTLTYWTNKIAPPAIESLIEAKNTVHLEDNEYAFGISLQAYYQ